MKIPALFV